jgi:hypothetical protein
VKKIISILLTLALALALAACGGGGGADGDTSSASTDATEALGQNETQEAGEAFKTCEIPGYFSFEVPAEAITSEVQSWSGSPRIHVAMPTSDWGLDIGHVSLEELYIDYKGFEAYMLMAEQYDSFKPVAIGGYAGFSVQHDISVITIEFPYGEATAMDQPFGSINIVERDEGDPSKHLDDPIVRDILDSIELIGTHVHSGAGSEEAPLDEEYLLGLGLSIAVLKPEGSTGVDVSVAKDRYVVNFSFEQDARVDVGLMARNAISAFRDVADSQKLYNVYVFREDPGRADEKTVDSLVKGMQDDFANGGIGAADFGFYTSGTPVYVYMTYGIVRSGASDERFPMLSISINE